MSNDLNRKVKLHDTKIKNKASISVQFILSILSIVIILVIMIVGITSYLLINSYDKQIRDDIDRTSNFIQKDVSTFVSGAYNLSYELADNPSVLTMNTEIQTPILEKAVSRNDYLELLYIQGTDGLQTGRSSGELGDRASRWWFVQMMADTKPFVSKSYYSVATNMPCTSVFIPMYDNNEMIGIFAADIKLGYIQSLIQNFSDEENGKYSFIIDGEGNVMAHPDNEYLETLQNYKTLTRTVSKKDASGNAMIVDNAVVTEEESFEISADYKAIIDKVMNGQNGVDKITENGTEYYISYMPIALSGNSDSWAVITLQEANTAMSVVSKIILNSISVAVIIAVIACIIIGISVRRITKPVVEMSKVAEQLANGNLDVSIKYSSNNEIGILAGSLSAHITGLRKLIKDIGNVLTSISDGVITVYPKENYSGDFTVINDSLNNIVSSLNDTLTQIESASNAVNSDATTLANSSVELAHNTNKQAVTMDELKSSFGGLSEELGLTAQKANKANEITAKTSADIDECNSLMIKMTVAMNEIRSSSDEIRKITKTIEDIAFQTNILALNASVEAARASAAGKEFSVVADEVRNLASRSAEAAKQTSDLITHTMQAVENGSGIAVRTEGVLADVVTETQKVRDSVDEISVAADMQDKMVKSLSANIDSMYETIQFTTASTQESAGSTSQLSDQANVLKDLICHFKL